MDRVRELIERLVRFPLDPDELIPTYDLAHNNRQTVHPFLLQHAIGQGITDEVPHEETQPRNLAHARHLAI
jgi:hypothetical protein